MLEFGLDEDQSDAGQDPGSHGPAGNPEGCSRQGKGAGQGVAFHLAAFGGSANDRPRGRDCFGTQAGSRFRVRNSRFCFEKVRF